MNIADIIRPEYTVVRTEWYTWATRLLSEMKHCPFCGAEGLRVFEQADSEPRRGCMACNRWVDPVRLQGP